MTYFWFIYIERSKKIFQKGLWNIQRKYVPRINSNQLTKGEIIMTTIRLYVPVYLDSQLEEIARITKMPLEELMGLSYCKTFLPVSSKISAFHFSKGLTGGEAIEYICKEHNLDILPIKRISISPDIYIKSTNAKKLDDLLSLSNSIYDDIMWIFGNLMIDNDCLFSILSHGSRSCPEIILKSSYSQLTETVQQLDHNEDTKEPETDRNGRVLGSFKTLDMTVRDADAETYKWSVRQLVNEEYDSIDAFLKTAEFFCQYQAPVNYTDKRYIEVDNGRQVYVAAKYKDTKFVIAIMCHDTEHGIFIDKVKVSQ